MKYRVIALLAAPLAVAACAAPGAAKTVTVTATAPEPVSTYNDVPSMSDDEEYLMLLYSEPGFYGVSERTLIDIGHGVCDALDSGYTPQQIASVALTSGLDSNQAASIVAASVVAICPWHSSQAQ